MRTLTPTERTIVACARDVALERGLLLHGPMLVDYTGDPWTWDELAREVLARLAAGDFDEAKHPRGEHGKFTESGGAMSIDKLLADNPQKPGEKLFEYQSRIVNGLDQQTKSEVLFQVRERYPPVDYIEKGAERWRQEHDLPDPDRDIIEQRVPLDEAERVARYFEDTPDQSGDPRVQAAYADFKRQNDEMYDYMTRDPEHGGLGIKVDFVKTVDPYDSARAQAEDLRQNHHINIESGLGGAHELSMTTAEYDRFRAVHDTFGHAGVGGGFDRHGEYEAWLEHSTMYTGLGQQAMSSEYHGINSALWSGATGTPGAGKTILLPEEYALPPWQRGSTIASLQAATKRGTDAPRNARLLIEKLHLDSAWAREYSALPFHGGNAQPGTPQRSMTADADFEEKHPRGEHGKFGEGEGVGDTTTMAAMFGGVPTDPAGVAAWKAKYGEQASVYAAVMDNWSGQGSGTLQRELALGHTDTPEAREFAAFLDNAPHSDVVLNRGTSILPGLKEGYEFNLPPSSFTTSGQSIRYALGGPSGIAAPVSHPGVITIEGGERALPVLGLSQYPDEQEMIAGGHMQIVSSKMETTNYYGKDVTYPHYTVRQVSGAQAALGRGHWWYPPGGFTPEEIAMGGTFATERAHVETISAFMAGLGWNDWDEGEHPRGFGGKFVAKDKDIAAGGTRATKYPEFLKDVPDDKLKSYMDDHYDQGMRGGGVSESYWVHDKSTDPETSYLLKRGDMGEHEGTNEMIASAILDDTSLPHGDVRIAEDPHNDNMGNFWVAVENLDNNKGYADANNFGGIRSTGSGMTEERADAIRLSLFDQVTGNQDGHTGNFMNVKVNGEPRIAPIDNSLILGGRGYGSAGAIQTLADFHGGGGSTMRHDLAGGIGDRYSIPRGDVAKVYDDTVTQLQAGVASVPNEPWVATLSPDQQDFVAHEAMPIMQTQLDYLTANRDDNIDWLMDKSGAAY